MKLEREMSKGKQLTTSFINTVNAYVDVVGYCFFKKLAFR